ncbi:ribonuclease H2 subunit C-like [Homalodisca vitripennis]|uniref:ribonuclease H2 subunit C-like n=1 Tax=Homalodisca vitripennis TaxID=197043 RepID=UPI001EEB22A6|nr:ribonuclease H2 subunit C-like [Homalodisca vitripennis]
MNGVVHIQNSESIQEISEKSVHYIPCKIHVDGSAKVSQYFLSSTNKDGELEASFRGHPLKGKIVELPKGYKGLILEETIQRSEDQERTLHVTKTFSELTYWNWDKVPTKNDMFLAAMDWIDIADALHSPVDEV